MLAQRHQELSDDIASLDLHEPPWERADIDPRNIA
jgi:hypothetical protein